MHGYGEGALRMAEACWGDEHRAVFPVRCRLRGKPWRKPHTGPGPFSDPQFNHADQTQSSHGGGGGAARLELARTQEIRSGEEDRGGGALHVPDFQEPELSGVLRIGKVKGRKIARELIGRRHSLLTVLEASGLLWRRCPGQQEYEYRQPSEQAAGVR